MKGTLKASLNRIRWVLAIAGVVSFIAGYAIAVIGGIWWPNQEGFVSTLVIMGLVVGFLNISAKEIIPYLVAAIALVLVGQTDVFTPLNDVRDGLGDDVNDVVGMMSIFTAPAAVVQAVRAGIALSKPD